MVSATQIKQWIEQNLPDSEVIIEGDGHHFEAVVICAQFDGKLTLARHRLVYGSLGSKMGDEIHALSLQTYTPQEYAEKR